LRFHNNCLTRGLGLSESSTTFSISRFQIILHKFNKFWISVGSVAAMTLLFFTVALCGVAVKKKTGCRGHSWIAFTGWRQMAHSALPHCTPRERRGWGIWYLF